MKKVFLAFSCVLFVGTMAFGDWAEGDPYKMHYPQMPDPDGWDVSFMEGPLGDDWECTETGPVNDIHMWVSFREDVVPSPEGFVGGNVEIWSNAPADAVVPYSRPKEWLWGMEIDTMMMPNVTMRKWYEEGPQRWLEPWYTGPQPGVDHYQIYQINIDPINDPDVGIVPFVQDEGEIYWLVAHLFADDPMSPGPLDMGWKTSIGPQFMDDGVFSSYFGGPSEWEPLIDPESGLSLDLAFVITPEPVTMMLLGVGGVALLRRRRG